MSVKIKKNRYVVWEVDPGDYHLEFCHRGILVERVELDITCEADQISYFYMIGTDRETHQILQADNETGRARVGEFSLAGWFKNGSLVTESE